MFRGVRGVVGMGFVGRVWGWSGSGGYREQ